MSTVDRILELVSESGLTAKDFANKAGLAGGSITDWKTGRSKPSVESLQKIAKYANVQLEWLTGDSKFKTIESLVDEYLNAQHEIDIRNALAHSSLLLLKANLNTVQLETLRNILLSNSTNEVKGNMLGDFANTFSGEQKKIVIEAIESALDYIINQDKSRMAYNNFIQIKYNKASNKTLSTFQKVPILGKIAAGQPILAAEYIEGYLPVDPNIYGMTTAEDLFYLRIAGNSMNLKVKNGDYALIRKQDYAEDGDIIAVIVNSDDEATLKRYKKLNDQFILLEPMSTDPTIESITVDLKTTQFQIIGKAIGQFGKF